MHSDHIDRAWEQANARVAARFTDQSTDRDGDVVRWNLRMKAAERGIWKSTELRRMLAEAGLEISAGKMSALWTGTPTTIRLEDLDVICAVLDCDADRPADPRAGQGRRAPSPAGRGVRRASRAGDAAAGAR